MNKTLSIFFILLSSWAFAQQRSISLSGEWKFQTDPNDTGIKEKWYGRSLSGHILLPGSMTSNHLGDEITVNTPWTGSIQDSSWFIKPEYAAYRKPGDIKVPFWLQPEKYYKGVAWYQKKIFIPEDWKGKPVELFIERAHWSTTLYADGLYIGTRNSLGAPHQYLILSGLAPGAHTLTIRIDNRVEDINIGQNSHSITDHTQGNWNGMVGRIYLQALPAIFVRDVQLFPDIEKKRVLARVVLEKQGKNSRQVQLKLRAILIGQNKVLPDVIRKIAVNCKSDTIEIVYPMGKSPELWSEHHPSVYRMVVNIEGGDSGDEHSVLFGMRKFSESGTQFTINGHPTMLRGTLDCAAFPLTGYPPTDVNSWLRILKTCKAFGLNHIRFHSWCPPDAAFEAADRLGFYFQIECSSWANQGATIGDGGPLDKYIYEESENIVRTYGNHPSFCLMDYGNEPAGKNLTAYLTKFVKFWEARDSRRLYTTGSGWPVIPESNYNSTPQPRIQHWGDGLNSVINGQRPSTNYDWSDTISKWQHPTVSHEIGEWCVYPDFKEITAYTGVFKAKNFEIFRDRLARNGLSAYEEKFLNASGKLQTLCYKADIEAALRTKGFGGFQLLGLEDFPGQGTALVGVLNAFYRPKSYITPAIFTQFCNDVVPLVRFPKMTYLNNEKLELPVEISQFSEHPLKSVGTRWTITGMKGDVIYSGTFGKLNIPEGNGIPLGKISQELKSIVEPQELILTIQVGKYANNWRFFVYPQHQAADQQKIQIVNHLSNEVIHSLEKGSTVLLSIKKGTLKAQYGGDIALGFSSIFWNTAWTNGQAPVTLGILCDPTHAAFKYFPTESHSDYQWWDAVTHGSPIMLDSVAKGIFPLVRVVDDWVTARSLGLLFECKVGKGKLMVSGIDLVTDADTRLEARQMLFSLEKYMNSSEFNPMTEVDPQKIAGIINVSN
jgi:hypothetical protein